MNARQPLSISALAASCTLLLAGAAAGTAQAQPPAGGPVTGPMNAPPRPLIANAQPVRSCESLANVALPNTTIDSAALDEENSDICRVTAIYSHPGADDAITIWFAAPMSGWNGRFLGTGGGAYTGGNPGGVNGPVSQGFAAGATNTGHDQGPGGSFALDDNGRLAWQRIRNNAHVGIHRMTVTGKALTEALYANAPGYSYFNGCSAGGRQALMAVQRYPQDYDGIVAGAPAINWPELRVHQLWAPMLMNYESNPVAQCKLDRATAAAIAACDTIDGVEDGVIEDPTRCEFDPAELVGTSSDQCDVFTAADASIVRRIWEGPRGGDGRFLWHGMSMGADLNAMAGSRGEPLQPQAFFLAVDWYRYFLTQDPDFDWTTLTPASLERFHEQSVEQYGAVIGSNDPDLSAFRDRGGRAIVWHGWADQQTTPYSTVGYFEQVVNQMGGQRNTNRFMRLFMAPGVAHCGGGYGPVPTGQLDALVAWVEEGRAPDTIPAVLRDQDGEVIRTRPLCPYPQVAVYRGRGSTDEAENFVCRNSF
jgi:hypothetical protein